jgi:hypothetical protein
MMSLASGSCSQNYVQLLGLIPDSRVSKHAMNPSSPAVLKRDIFGREVPLSLSKISRQPQDIYTAPRGYSSLIPGRITSLSIRIRECSDSRISRWTRIIRVMAAKFKGLELLREQSDPREVNTSGATTSLLKRARQIGKRQNPAYQQISAYVRRDLYEKIRRDLIGRNDDFSDLLEQWMEAWLSGKG